MTENAYEIRHVVTSFLVHEGRVLLLRRSGRVGTYRGRWAGVAGFLEPGSSGADQALQEIVEETGLGPDDVRLVREGAAVEVADDQLRRVWIVHPFRFEALAPAKIRLDWEHTEMRWIDPGEMSSYPCVPGLADAWAAVAG